MAERPARRRLEDKTGGSAPRASGTRRKPGGQGGGRSAAAPGPAAKSPISPGYGTEPESRRAEEEKRDVPRDRGLRRAMFLVELAEARELRRRVAPRRARAAELHARLLRTFRY